MHGGRLPAETSRFFGRSQEAAAIRDALSRSRLITLTGPGGVGKTRLALRVAGELTDAFPDGVCLVPLSAARDADGLAHAAAAALGLPAEAGEWAEPAEWADRLAGRLQGSRMLVILDTCEHLVADCAAFASAVRNVMAGPVVLATSRQPLDLPGEVVFRIPPLDAAEEGGDAVALFADRAGAAVPGFAVTDDVLAKVVRLCRVLDGIPFEIERAALLLRAVGLDELLTRLPGRLRLLTVGHRSDDRQQTVQASITWSYDLCTQAERLLWNRLSVFSGGFDLAAAEAVCGGGDLPVEEVLETLIGLVDKSVVLRDAAALEDARYRLLEVVREQGAEQVTVADAAECAARHRDHYLGVARRFAASFIGPDQVGAVARLAKDAANLRLVLERSLATGDHGAQWPAAGAELAVACLPWWACSGQLAEASLWFSRLSRREPATAEPATDDGALRLMDLLAGLATAFESLTRGAFGEGTARCAAVMAGLPDGERWVRGWAAWVTGLAGWLGGDLAAAGRWLREGLELHAPFDDDLSVAQHLEAFAWLAAARGEHRRTCWLQGAADKRWRRLMERRYVRVPRFGAALLHLERDRAERTARDALGPVRYAAGHSAGGALDGQDVLRCALGELHPRSEQGDRWQLLTAREREVAALVAKGMTNKGIAGALFVSRRTIDAHVEHILAKLSYASRVQVAALVAHEQAYEEGAEQPGEDHEHGRQIPVPRMSQEEVTGSATKRTTMSLCEHDSLGMV